MIENFYGGVKETPEELVGETLGCGCYCHCPNQVDSANGQSTSMTDLHCGGGKFTIIIPPVW